MCYDYMVFEVPVPKPTEGTKWPTDGKKWFARVPVLKNVKKLSQGDLLSLPFFDDKEK